MNTQAFMLSLCTGCHLLCILLNSVVYQLVHTEECPPGLQAAYKSLADELDVQDGSEPDEAIIAAKDAKRLRKATQQLAPVLLGQAEVTGHPAAPHSTPAPHHLARSNNSHLSSIQLSCRRQQQHFAIAPEPVSAGQLAAGGFAAIGGLGDVKRQLREMVLMPLMYPEVMKQLGIKPPR